MSRLKKEALFTQGYALACANLIRLHGRSVPSDELLKEGSVTIESCWQSRVDSADMLVLEPILRELEAKPLPDGLLTPDSDEGRTLWRMLDEEERASEEGSRSRLNTATLISTPLGEVLLGYNLIMFDWENGDYDEPHLKLTEQGREEAQFLREALVSA